MTIDFDEFIGADGGSLSVRDGYAAWAPRYDDMLTDTVDGPILARFTRSLPTRPLEIVDLGCGTGRNILWLRSRGVRCDADGVDLSPEMIERAREKKVYRKMEVSDCLAANCPSMAYDVVLNVLAACHIADLRGLYGKAFELLKGGGRFWLIDMHPHLFLMGKGTSVPLGGDKPIQIKNYIHLFRDHVGAARDAGFQFEDFEESLVPEAWGSKSKNYRSVIGHPLGFGYSWGKP